MQAVQEGTFLGISGKLAGTKGYIYQVGQNTKKLKMSKLLSVAKAGSGLVVQQHLVVGYKACTSYMQLLLPYHHNTSTANY